MIVYTIIYFKGTMKNTSSSLNRKVKNMTHLLKAIYEDSYHIRDLIHNFYPYRYDGFNKIEDGGYDMFDLGNQVSKNLKICINYLYRNGVVKTFYKKTLL